MALLEQSDAERQALERLLRMALEDVDLGDLLRRALALVLEGKWPATLGVGAVFLVDEQRHELVLQAHNGIGEEIAARCERVQFGECLCGRVARTGEPIHSAEIDHRHEVCHPAMAPHGHYCMPIAAGEILKAAESAAALTRRLLTFSRKQLLKPEIVDLNAIITSIEGMLRRLIGEDIEVFLHLAPGLRPVKADRVQIEQVLLNLVVNARDAMPAGGRITIATQNLYVGAGDSTASPSVEPGHHVLLSVIDSGHGMAPEVKARVFEPFFTTKEAGKGTGLGLSTVYGIVKQSNGHIWVDSDPGCGTRVHVCFPRVLSGEDG